MTAPAHSNWLPVLALLLWVLVCQRGAAQNVGSKLETFGYDASRDGVLRCLGNMVWTPEREAEFEQYLVDLDSDNYGTRDSATVALTVMASLPHDRLEFTLNQRNISVEKRRRILQVLDYNTALRRELLLYLAANAITTQRHMGLASSLLHAANSVPVTQRGVWDATRTAMLRTAVKEDAPALRAGIELPEPTARAIACEALVAVEGTQALPTLRPLLTDPDPRVRFHAALAYRSFRSHECVSTFISLLDTTLPDAYQKHDIHIRFNSVEILKKLTGQRFGYRAAHVPDVRAAYIQKWQTWFEKNGSSMALDFESTGGPDSPAQIDQSTS